LFCLFRLYFFQVIFTVVRHVYVRKEWRLTDSTNNVKNSKLDENHPTLVKALRIWKLLWEYPWKERTNCQIVIRKGQTVR
jgi:hypothetical protein